MNAKHVEPTDRITQHVSIRSEGSSRSRCSIDVVDDNVGDDRSKKTALKTTSFRSHRTTGKTSRVDELEQSHGALPKNLISPLSYIVRHRKTLKDTTWRPSPRRTVIAAHDPGATQTGLAVDASIKDSVFLDFKNKTRHEAHSRNMTASRCDESSRDERAAEEEGCSYSPILTHLPRGRTIHLIRWCNSSQTSNVGLNFSTHFSCNSHMSCHQYGMHHTWALRFRENLKSYMCQWN